MFYKATVFVVRKVSLPLELTCTYNTLSPPAALTASHPGHISKQIPEGTEEKVSHERFVSQIVVSCGHAYIIH